MAEFQEIFLPDENATLALGVKISRCLKPGDIVGLSGGLGAGKTTLTRGIVSGFGGNSEEVHSPTFSLIHVYNCPTVSINHCDFYRLEEGSELPEFGGLEFFFSPEIYLIEWLERISLLPELPSERLYSVHLEHDSMGRKARVPKKWKILD